MSRAAVRIDSESWFQNRIAVRTQRGQQLVAMPNSGKVLIRTGDRSRLIPKIAPRDPSPAGHQHARLQLVWPHWATLLPHVLQHEIDLNACPIRAWQG